MQQKKPEDRWNSSAELVAALEPFVHSGRTVMATASQLGTDGDDFQALRPSRMPRVVAAFGLALVLGAVGFFALRSPPAEAVGVEKPAAPPVAPPVVEEAKSVTLEVATHPAGAKVIRLDTNEVLGLTPLKLEVARLDGPVSLRLELLGHQTTERQVSCERQQHRTGCDQPAPCELHRRQGLP